MAAPRFQPEEIFRVLEKHRVRYVLIGGLAATLHGSNLRTGDADICPERSPENLSRLVAALGEIDARVRAEGVPEGLAFERSAEILGRVLLLNLSTRHGDFDLSFEPSGTSGYEDLVGNRVIYELDDLAVPVASLEDVIRSKEAAGSPKDQQQLPALRMLLEERRRRGGG